MELWVVKMKIVEMKNDKVRKISWIYFCDGIGEFIS